jgi:hypothetical protein
VCVCVHVCVCMCVCACMCVCVDAIAMFAFFYVCVCHSHSLTPLKHCHCSFFFLVHSPPPPPGPLRCLKNKTSGESVNVVAVVMSSTRPIATRGTDMRSEIVITAGGGGRDPLELVTVTVFAPSLAHFPPIRWVSQPILIQSATVAWYRRNVQLVINLRKSRRARIITHGGGDSSSLAHLSSEVRGEGGGGGGGARERERERGRERVGGGGGVVWREW